MEKEVYVLIGHDGSTDRVVVDNGVIEGGLNHGMVLENIEGMYAQTLRLSASNDTAMEQTRAKHVQILANIADEVRRNAQ